MLGLNSRLVILMYHRVLRHPDPLRSWDVDAATFAWQLKTLDRWFNVLPLRVAVDLMRRRELPPRAICITFDDGYADNHDVALPLLQRHKMHATFFIATGYLDGGRMWNDTVLEALARFQGPVLNLEDIGLDSWPMATEGARVQSSRDLLRKMKYLTPPERIAQSMAIAARIGQPLPDNLMMTLRQVRDLHAAGMEIGAHTVSHPILARVSAQESLEEMTVSRNRLREILGVDVATFAYPNGNPGKDYLQRDAQNVRSAGFELAVSTAWGCAHSQSDMYQLARIAPWDATPARFALRIIRSYFGAPAATV